MTQLQIPPVPITAQAPNHKGGDKNVAKHPLHTLSWTTGLVGCSLCSPTSPAALPQAQLVPANISPAPRPEDAITSQALHATSSPRKQPRRASGGPSITPLRTEDQ